MKTDIDMVWRATSGDSTDFGAGLWLNTGVLSGGVGGDYGYLRFGAKLDGDVQTFNLQDSTGVIDTADFGAGMLTLDAYVDHAASTVTYSVTDGSTTLSGSKTYGTSVEIKTATSGWATMFTRNPGFEVDYIKIASVPEPMTLSLLGLGGLGLVRRRRK